MEMFYKGWGYWKESTIVRDLRDPAWGWKDTSAIAEKESPLDEEPKLFKQGYRRALSFVFQFWKIRKMTNENVSCFFSKNEKFSKTKNFKFEMSSTVVRPAARVNISLIFFRKIRFFYPTLLSIISFYNLKKGRLLLSGERLNKNRHDIILIKAKI